MVNVRSPYAVLIEFAQDYDLKEPTFKLSFNGTSYKCITRFFEFTEFSKGAYQIEARRKGAELLLPKVRDKMLKIVEISKNPIVQKLREQRSSKSSSPNTPNPNEYNKNFFKFNSEKSLSKKVADNDKYNADDDEQTEDEFLDVENEDDADADVDVDDDDDDDDDEFEVPFPSPSGSSSPPSPDGSDEDTRSFRREFHSRSFGFPKYAATKQGPRKLPMELKKPIFSFQETPPAEPQNHFHFLNQKSKLNTMTKNPAPDTGTFPRSRFVENANYLVNDSLEERSTSPSLYIDYSNLERMTPKVWTAVEPMNLRTIFKRPSTDPRPFIERGEYISNAKTQYIACTTAMKADNMDELRFVQYLDHVRMPPLINEESAVSKYLEEELKKPFSKF